METGNIYKKTNNLYVKILCSIILLVLITIVVIKCVSTSENSGKEKALGPYPILKDTFEITWTIDETVELTESDVERLDANVLIFDDEEEMYYTEYDYAEITSIDLKIENGVKTVTVVYYPKKAGTIYSMLFLDKEAIGASPPIYLEKENNFGKNVKTIVSTILIQPFKMITVTQYEFWNSDTVPVLFADKLVCREDDENFSNKAGTIILIIMLIGLLLVWILKKLQYDRKMKTSVVFFSYLWSVSFIIPAIFIWDRKYGCYSSDLGYTPFIKKILCIGYGIILIISTICLIWHIVKHKFGKKELLSFVLTNLAVYIIFHMFILYAISAIIIWLGYCTVLWLDESKSEYTSEDAEAFCQYLDELDKANREKIRQDAIAQRERWANEKKEREKYVRDNWDSSRGKLNSDATMYTTPDGNWNKISKYGQRYEDDNGNWNNL